MMKLHDELMYV